MRSLALTSLVVLLLAAPARGQVAEGDFRLEGKLWPSRRAYTAVLHVRRTAAGAWRIERTARTVDEDGRLVESTWAATEALVKGAELRVRLRPGTLGAAGALEALDGEGDELELEARYTFSAEGLSERAVARDASGDHWRLATAKGELEAPTLTLVKERRFEDLLGDRLDRYEASGVVLAGGVLRVVFDNSGHVAEVAPSLARADLFKTGGGQGKSDLEGVTYDAETGKSYAVVEQEKRGAGERFGRVWELDENLRRVDREWLKLELPKGNKGFEGLAHVRRGGEEYLLALLEGNGGEAGEEALARGEGRIELFRRDGGDWKHEGTLKLPRRAYFYDYSGIDVRDGRVAVVSQTSSAVWIGELSPTTWRFRDEGRVLRFPRQASRVVYGNVEGVTWLDASRLACVSDAGPGDKAESIHIFELPE